MSVVVAWLLFPVVLLAVSGGCGLLVEYLGGLRLPGALVPSVGFAAVIVLASALTYKSAIAGLTTPVVVAVSLAGYVAGWGRLRASRPDLWAIATGAGLFAVYAAPVVLTGQATFLGYFFLNDTSVHFALVDQLFSHGRDVAAAPPSGIRSIVGGYLASGYPVGAHAGLGAVRPLVGQDVAWVFAPYLAVMLSLAGVALHTVLAGVVESRRLALAALVAVAAFPVYDRIGKFVDTASNVLTVTGDLGNLIRPLEWWQLLGIWPRGDFRFPIESHQQAAFALMGIALAALVIGALWLVRRAALAPLLLLATSLVVAYVLTREGSPYANAKVLMIASPA